MWRSDASGFALEEGLEGAFPVIGLLDDGFGGIEAFFEGESGYRFGEAKDADAVGEFEHEKVDLRFHGGEFTVKSQNRRAFDLGIRVSQFRNDGDNRAPQLQNGLR
jgi:hypothetical protein